MNKHSIQDYSTRLAESARHLLSVSSDATDGAVKEARMQLESALESGKRAFEDIRERSAKKLDVVQAAVRKNPCALVGVAFACGVLIAFAVGRRSK